MTKRPTKIAKVIAAHKNYTIIPKEELSSLVYKMNFTIHELQAELKQYNGILIVSNLYDAVNVRPSPFVEFRIINHKVDNSFALQYNQDSHNLLYLFPFGAIRIAKMSNDNLNLSEAVLAVQKYNFSANGEYFFPYNDYTGNAFQIPINAIRIGTSDQLDATRKEGLKSIINAIKAGTADVLPEAGLKLPIGIEDAKALHTIIKEVSSEIQYDNKNKKIIISSGSPEKTIDGFITLKRDDEKINQISISSGSPEKTIDGSITLKSDDKKVDQIIISSGSPEEHIHGSITLNSDDKKVDQIIISSGSPEEHIHGSITLNSDDKTDQNKTNTTLISIVATALGAAGLAYFFKPDGGGAGRQQGEGHDNPPASPAPLQAALAQAGPGGNNGQNGGHHHPAKPKPPAQQHVADPSLGSTTDAQGIRSSARLKNKPQPNYRTRSEQDSDIQSEEKINTWNEYFADNIIPIGISTIIGSGLISLISLESYNANHKMTMVDTSTSMSPRNYADAATSMSPRVNVHATTSMSPLVLETPTSMSPNVDTNAATSTPLVTESSTSISSSVDANAATSTPLVIASSTSMSPRINANAAPDTDYPEGQNASPDIFDGMNVYYDQDYPSPPASPSSVNSWSSRGGQEAAQTIPRILTRQAISFTPAASSSNQQTSQNIPKTPAVTRNNQEALKTALLDQPLSSADKISDAVKLFSQQRFKSYETIDVKKLQTDLTKRLIDVLTTVRDSGALYNSLTEIFHHEEILSDGFGPNDFGPVYFEWRKANNAAAQQAAINKAAKKLKLGVDEVQEIFDSSYDVSLKRAQKISLQYPTKVMKTEASFVYLKYIAIAISAAVSGNMPTAGATELDEFAEELYLLDNECEAENFEDFITLKEETCALDEEEMEQPAITQDDPSLLELMAKNTDKYTEVAIDSVATVGMSLVVPDYAMKPAVYAYAKLSKAMMLDHYFNGQGRGWSDWIKNIPTHLCSAAGALDLIEFSKYSFDSYVGFSAAHQIVQIGIYSAPVLSVLIADALHPKTVSSETGLVLYSQHTNEQHASFKLIKFALTSIIGNLLYSMTAQGSQNWINFVQSSYNKHEEHNQDECRVVEIDAHHSNVLYALEGLWHSDNLLA